MTTSYVLLSTFLELKECVQTLEDRVQTLEKLLAAGGGSASKTTKKSRKRTGVKKLHGYNVFIREIMPTLKDRAYIDSIVPADVRKGNGKDKMKAASILWKGKTGQEKQVFKEKAKVINEKAIAAAED